MPFQAPQAWPEPAIHDTVVAIVTGRGYARGVGESLLGKAFELFGRMLVAIARAVERIPHAREIAYAILIAIGIVIVVQLIIAHRLRDDQARVRFGGPGGRHVDAWAAAQRLAAEGRFTEAAHALYRAVLERLSASDGVRLHPSKTSGDYVRELRRRGSRSAILFRTFSRRFDAVIFGTGVCEADDFAALMREAEPMIAGGAAP
jgi:hypothetical protein